MIRSLTSEQSVAVTTTDRSVCVSACAGSGKTTVLVERYKRLVIDKGIDPQHILAITYTDMAAQHMKARLRREFALTGCARPVKRLEQAAVGTIHSFCKDVIGQYPFECGIVAPFSILDEGTALIMRSTIMRTLLDDVEFKDAALTILTEFGKSLDETRGAEYHLLKLYGSIRSAGVDCRGGLFRSVASQEFAACMQQLRAALDEVMPHVQDDKRGKAKKEKLAVIESLYERLVADTLPDVSIAAALFSGADLGSSQTYGDVLEGVSRAIKRVAGCVLAMHSRVLYGALERVLAAFDARYTDRKQEQRMLDFDDLIVKAHMLLCGNTAVSAYVRERLKAQYRYVLLDECQDTNALQFEILQSIARTDNLFIVGDVRQAIYGFRGADVAVMRTQQEAYASDATKARIALSYTHRATKKLVGFINDFFVAYDDAHATHDFEPMAAVQDNPHIPFPVEIICNHYGGADDPVDKARFREAEILADTIDRLIREKVQIRDGNGGYRAVRYGDMTVLFRQMTSAAIYEYVFRVRGVPFRTVTGEGFYDTTEVSDIVNVLRLLDDPSDDVVACAVVRSAVCGVSDDGLYWLGQSGSENDSFFMKVRAYEANRLLSPVDAAVLGRFLAVFDELHASKRTLGIYGLIARLIEKTDYDIVVLGRDDGERRYANIEKLQAIAKDFDRKGIFQLQEFIAYVADMERFDIREKEVETMTENRDAVTLMSIHRAKGLEFPVVIIADMGARKRHEAPLLLFSRENGAGARIALEGCRKSEGDVRWFDTKERIDAVRDEEDMRILYVGMTRAQDMLVLLGSREVLKQSSADRAAATWMQMFSAYVDCQENDGNDHVREWHDDVTGVRGRIVTRAQVSHVARARSVVKDAVNSTVGSATVDDVDLERITAAVRPLVIAHEHRRVFSATEVVAYKSCPRRYYYMYVANIPALLLPRSEGKQTHMHMHEATYPSSDIRVGIAFHAFARRWRPHEATDEIVSRECAYYRRVLTPEQQAVLEQCVRQYAHGALRTYLAAQCSDLFPEMPFVARVADRSVLRGQIDLLGRAHDRGLVVVEYKTTTADDDERQQAYSLQCDLYCHSLRKMNYARRIQGVVYRPYCDGLQTIEYADSDFDRIESELIDVVTNICDGVFDKCAGAGCVYCDYATLCGKGK